jgi:hypothetical protein
MRIQKKNDKKYIILDENESVSLIAKGKRQTNGMNVTNIDGRMDVKADPKSLDVIKNESVIEKCDRWFETFTKVHDMFRDLALTDRCKKRNINMQVGVSSYAYLNAKGTGKCIDIDLKRRGDMIQEGPFLEIPTENEDVFKYMFARVLEYYLTKNYGDTEIVLPDIWSYRLTSGDQVEYEEVFPAEFNMSILRELPDYRELIKKIVYKYNLGLPIKPLIEELRNKIEAPLSTENIDKSLDYSERKLDELNEGRKM